MASESDNKDFKSQWNYFTSYMFDLYETRFGDNVEQKSEFKSKFNACKSNEERLQLVLEDGDLKRALVAGVDGEFSKIAERNGDYLETTKRLLSNLEHGDHAKVIQTYTIAISLLLSCHPDLEQQKLLADCLTKRADLLYLFEQYADVLEDINDARKLRIPPEKTSLMGAMEAQCRRKLKGKSRLVKPSEMKVQEESQELESCTANVMIDYSPEKGRIMRSTARISEKTIITAEEPYACWLRPNGYSKYCNQCLVKLSARFLYCSGCLDVKYCSVECRDKAWITYHNVECKHIEVLKKWAMGHLALRMVIIPGVDIVLAIEKSEKLPIKESLNNGFSSEYQCIQSLTGEQCLLDDYYVIATIGAAFMALVASKMKLIDEQNEDFCLFAGVIFKHIAQVYLNTYTVYDQRLRTTEFKNILLTDEDKKKIGVTLYATSSLFSHSCENNCYKYYCGSKIIIVNHLPIEAGAEITVNYGTCSSQSTIQDRYDFLMANFGFACKCEACITCLECIAYSYNCPYCNGPLIINENDTNYCCQCSKRDVDLVHIKNKVDKVQKLMKNGEELFNAKKFDKSKECYINAESLLKNIYFSNVRLLGIHTYLSEIYENKSKYDKAYKFKIQTKETIAELFGDESLEMVNLLTESGLLLKKAAKKSLMKKTKFMTQADECFEDAFKIFTRASTFEFQIISDARRTFLKHFSN
ncbi:SET and MYND domain-containing protein 4-like protein [Leptotrombidium deliense]|uniref:SET and MYND domain-containing protein 4-like protein n=1 Tax=Leptotrombidium deliense TaxID=299467 RepID=A0A443SM75_9ACAR|nr:SET and MYND domain-containing protein 4-like protein [Leptotrombidium deliense]